MTNEKPQDDQPAITDLPELPAAPGDDKVKGGGWAKVPSPSGPIPIPYPNLPR